ncbi:Zinc finger and SCAN domain-containing protein 5B [Lemmus lemmus]
MSFLRGSGLEMAKAKADDWGDDLVVLSDDSLSSDQASPGSQNLPRTKSRISQRLCSSSADSLSTSHRKASCMGNTEDGQLAVATLQLEESVVHLVGRAWFGYSQCNKSFLYRSQFIIHQRTHTGERPSQCRLCQKEFVQSSDLGVDQCIHTGEKPYWCCICSKVFTRESFLLGHIRTHTKEMPYLCEHCGKRLNHKGNLDIHGLDIHGDSRPYRCMECNEAFQQKGTLIRHVKIHSREVPL